MAELTAIRLPPPAAAEAIVAAWDAGQAVLPLDARSPASAARRALETQRPTELLDEDGRRRLADGRPVGPEVAAVVLTSGTTADPRGVELNWDGLRASAVAVSAAVGTGPDDAWLCCLPLHHVAGLAVLARAWVTGLPVMVRTGFPDDARHSGTTLVSLVPIMLHRALVNGAPLRRFRRVLVGGAAVPDDLRRRAGAAGVRLVTTYGLTETWGGVVHDGRALSGVDLRLGPDNEIELRSAMTMKGYRLDPEATSAAFTPDRWLRTGDVGTFEPDGRLEVVDRLKDMVISGGVNVSPTEVEAVLARHPAVHDVCVAGAPDPEWGERVVAFVVPAEGAERPTLATLRAFASDHLAGPKLPRQVVAVAQIPRTPGGKPVRRLLRAPPN